MRIASLVPSTTEIVAALGLAADLVARTHECDYPPEVERVPAVTRDLLPPGMTPAQIDAAVFASVRDRHTIYALDADALHATRPDIVLTQSTCAVCAVDRATVDDACSMGGAVVVSYDPTTLVEILDGIAMIAKALDAEEAGRRVVDGLTARLAAVRGTCGGHRRPRVAVVEWPDPVYAPGHWVPDMVEAAGGQSVFGQPGGRSIATTVDALHEARPDVVIMAFCGYDLATNDRLTAELRQRPEWAPVLASAAKVVAIDGSAYTSRPGPRAVDGVELLASLLHPPIPHDHED